MQEKALFITWTEDSWSHKNIQDLNKKFKNDGFVIQNWRVKEFSTVKKGMPVIAYKQKQKQRGVFGIGYIENGPSKAQYKEKRKLPHRRFDVNFIYFSDPLSVNGPLISEKNCPKSINKVKRTRFSGKIIDYRIYLEILNKFSKNDTHYEETIINIKTASNQKLNQKKALKYDSSVDDEKRKLGYKGELKVLAMEFEKLKNLGLIHLANKICHVSKEDDSKGYDILSYDENSKKLYIEVKTTSLGKETSFFITDNEIQASSKYKSNYMIYRLYNFSDSNYDYYRLKGIVSEEKLPIKLIPKTYRVYLNFPSQLG